jgi:hypothetical protein
VGMVVCLSFHKAKHRSLASRCQERVWTEK